ncbi:hypothetical protein BS78_07G193100 [Paspalum vaginatum]|nr:hypothetical protein BS78_07G193100 [Paspalum vaginatum]
MVADCMPIAASESRRCSNGAEDEHAVMGHGSTPRLWNTGYWLSVGGLGHSHQILWSAYSFEQEFDLDLPCLYGTQKGGSRDRRPIDPMTGRPLDIEGLTIVDDPNALDGENVEHVLRRWHDHFNLCSIVVPS